MRSKSGLLGDKGSNPTDEGSKQKKRESFSRF
jgi:hypothetical protein